MNNQELVEQLREWADELATMPEAGDAIDVSLDVFDCCNFDEADAACLLSGRESVLEYSHQRWVVTSMGERGGITIYTTEEKARQICPSVPIEDIDVPAETLSGLSGQEVSG